MKDIITSISYPNTIPAYILDEYDQSTYGPIACSHIWLLTSHIIHRINKNIQGSSIDYRFVCDKEVITNYCCLQ
jgi:hypothetical protein